MDNETELHDEESDSDKEERERGESACVSQDISEAIHVVCSTIDRRQPWARMNDMNRAMILLEMMRRGQGCKVGKGEAFGKFAGNLG